MFAFGLFTTGCGADDPLTTSMDAMVDKPDSLVVNDSGRLDSMPPGMDANPAGPACEFGATEITPFRESAEVSWASVRAVAATLTTPAGVTEVALNGSITLEVLSDDAEIRLRVRDASGAETECVTQVLVAPPGNAMVVGVGQSNIEIYFTWDESRGSGPRFGTGAAYFERELRALDGVSDAAFINAAYGGSSVLQENVSASFPENYWLRETEEGFVPGPRLQSARERIRESRSEDMEVSMFLWAQGEADAGRIGARIRAAGLDPEAQARLLAEEVEKYSAGFRYVIDSLREAAGSGNVPFGIQMLGRRVSDSPEVQRAIHAIRLVQRQASETASVRVVANMYDSTLIDTVHMDPTGRELVLDRVIRSMEAWRSHEPPLFGPRMESARAMESSVRVAMAPSGDLRIGDNAHLLFAVLDVNGIVVGQPGSVRPDGNTLVLEFGDGIPATASRVASAYGPLSPRPAADFPGWSLAENGLSALSPLNLPLEPMEVTIGE